MPLNSTAVRDNIFPFIIDVDEPGKYNWIRPIYDSLVEGLTNFKKGLIQSLNGCVCGIGDYKAKEEAAGSRTPNSTKEKGREERKIENRGEKSSREPRQEENSSDKRAKKKEKLKTEEKRVAESPDKKNDNLKQEEEKIETKMEHENGSDKREYVESEVNESPPDPSIPSFDLHFDSPTVELQVDADKLYEWVMDGWEKMEETVASLRGKKNVFLKRTNARTLRPWKK
ncbi:hypothetical protein PIB30_035525 [Stylosanthes scabra]|uniref:Uncharacterized protein n=1 Tax=Stylosanthes scabra TaxID=79078 RepID=A0ABU6QCL9_9FABA|nr:hypothetical protein [Stylosanthes scabra]